MINLKKYGFITSLFFINLLFAQGNTVLDFLSINPSPESNSLGRSGAALPTTDSYGFYINPAQLGYASRSTVIAGQFYPGEKNFLPSIPAIDFTYNSWVFSLGYNYKDHPVFLPRCLGFGFMKNTFDYGTYTVTDMEGSTEEIHSRETVDAFSLGVGWDFYVNLNLGFTYKIINSRPIPLPGFDTGEIKENAVDYGMLLIIPALKFLNKKDDKPYPRRTKFFGFFDVALGYAKTNIGDKVLYYDPNPAPIPRTAQLAYTLSGGIDMEYKNVSLNAFSLDWSADAVDLLVDEQGNYQGGFWGDIDVWNNLILAKSDDEVRSHKGLRFQCLEALQFGYGKLRGPGIEEDTKTWGFGVKLKGLMKLFTANSYSQLAIILREYVDVQYLWAKYIGDENNLLYGKTYQSIGLFITGF
jgi:hypothetical protein